MLTIIYYYYDNNFPFMEDVWQASLVIKVRIIKTLNIQEKINYINVVHSLLDLCMCFIKHVEEL